MLNLNQKDPLLAQAGLFVSAEKLLSDYSTVTLLARFLGWSTSVPFSTEM
jgi:hypothetical protein